MHVIKLISNWTKALFFSPVVNKTDTNRFSVPYQGGGRRLQKYHLVDENCVLVGENLFDLPDLVGEKICMLKIYVS